MSPVTEETKEDETIVLVVTAFGPFLDVEENPSNILLDELPSFLEPSSGASWKFKVKDKIKELCIVETSAEGSREALQGLASKIAKNRDVEAHSKVLCLHLGVNVFGSGYELEKCAYNDASFRIPDQRNYQPNNLPIRPEVPLGEPSHTRCPVPDLVEHLSHAFPAIESKVGTDPGRFVCNYLYYTSLNKLQDELPNSVNACLFLHIPPFEKIPKDIQLEYLAELMRILTRVELS